MAPGDGEALVREARRTVESLLLRGRRPEPDPAFGARFGRAAGVFVTIERRGRLRGCVGYPEPARPLREALPDAAAAAATADPRFAPMSPAELDGAEFEVTVLSPPEEVRVSDPSEYPSRIRVGRDGLVVRAGGRSGLLLPQVPAALGWGPEEFLSGACEKAGLPAGAWRGGGVAVERFGGRAFRERGPAP